jgi:hypothetical protein
MDWLLFLHNGNYLASFKGDGTGLVIAGLNQWIDSSNT